MTSHLPTGQSQSSRDAARRDAFPLPLTIGETGLPVYALTALTAKTMQYRVRVSEGELCDLLQLARPVVDEILETMRRETLVETMGRIGPLQFEYALTDRGRQHALEASERDRYVGPAPVPFEQYLRVQATQSVDSQQIDAGDVRAALSHLVQPESLVRSVGAAVTSASTLLLHGATGNGKSAVAGAVRQMLRHPVAIPHALDISGHTVRLYDPRVHQALETPSEPPGGRAVSGFRSRAHDARYVACHPPLITLGSELTLGDLGFGFSPSDRTYTAPPQMKANGGVLVVDDLGRQRVRPEDLLNRWMAPIATRVDQLALLTGEIVRVPFDVILVIATNLQPAELGDEAFLRRIRHKVAVGDPTRAAYVEIFERAAQEMGIPLAPGALETLIETFYTGVDRPFRGAHPGDILRNVSDFARFDGEPAVGDARSLDRACQAYFG